MLKNYSLPLAVSLFALATPALGQNRPDTSVSDEIVVTATRTAQAPEAIGASVTVLDAEDIRTAGSAPVVDLLRDVAGVSVTRNGGVGGVASVRIRGAESDQTVLLIDGVKLNDPSQPGGGFNFANLLVGDIARIEILRGPQSTLYGSQAIGGVINIITRTPENPFEASVAAEAGELSTTSVRAAVRGITGDLQYGLAAGRFESDSVSAAANGLERDNFESTSVQARATYSLSPIFNVEGRVWWSSSDVGIDGFPAPSFTLTDTPERSETEERILFAAANLALLDGRWRTQLSLNQTRIERDNRNPTLSTPLTFTAQGDNNRVEVQSVFDVNPELQIVGGYELETSEFRTASPSSFDPNPVPATADVDQRALYAQIQATPFAGLTATLGARGTDHERFGEAINLRATLAWALNNGDTVIRAAAADGFKAPTLFQLFSDFGNVTLQPEDAYSFEAGVEQAWFDRRIIGAVTWFERTAKNQIDFISCFGSTRSICIDRPFGVYDNIARVQADGVEATLQVRPLDAVSITAGYTSLDARNATKTSPNFNRRLPRRPESTAFVTASFKWAPDSEVSATVSSIGESFDNAANTVPLPAYEVLTLRASWALTDHVNVYARIENATDEVYQTTAGYSAPPRQAIIGLRAAF